MTGKQLFEANINIRLNDNDLNALRSEANKQRIPLSTYCRTILTKHLQQMKYHIKLVKGAEDEIIKTPVMNKKKSVSLNMNFTEKELQLMKAISGLKGNQRQLATRQNKVQEFISFQVVGF